MAPWVIPLMLMAAGSAVQYSAQKKANRKTQAAISEGERRQSELLSKKRKIALDKDLPQYDPETRRINQAELEQKSTDQFAKDLQQSRDMGVNIEGGSGRISQAFSTDKAKQIAAELDRASKTAGMFARYRGPTDLRREEGINMTRTGSDKDVLTSLGQSRASTDQQLIRNASIPNQGMMTLGTLLSSAGSMYGMYNMGAGMAGAGKLTGGQSMFPAGMAQGQASMMRIPPGVPGGF